MSTRITAPVAGLNGTGVGGLRFENSVAETDSESVIAYCKSAGYKVEQLDKPPTPPKDPDVPQSAAKKTAAKKA